MKQIFYLCLTLALFMTGCSQSGPKRNIADNGNNTINTDIKAEMPLKAISPPLSTGSIERFSNKLDSILPKESNLEIIAEGFIWSEGPVWLSEHNKLIFSDIPRNTIFQWSDRDGLSVYLDSAGYDGLPTGPDDLGGSNGLLLDSQGHLILCQHGKRRIARMDAPLDKPEPKYSTVTDNYKGKKFNSPNDAVFNSKGDLYFTDPPYGLPNQGEGPSKELDIQGVYKLSVSGELTLIVDNLKRPNGIGLSPDEKTLYVSNSDPDNPVWMAYSLNAEGIPVDEKILFNATEYVKTRPDMGLPDGLKVDRKGNIFGTGPQGVYILTPGGELLGIINTGHANGNCTFNEDGSTLYITSDMYLMRINLK